MAHMDHTFVLPCTAQDLVTPLCELAPYYAVDSVVHDLLTSDSSDCVMAGLKALHSLATTVPPLGAALLRQGQGQGAAAEAGAGASSRHHGHSQVGSE